MAESNPTIPDPKKVEWPELVGKKGEDAVKIIKEENPRMTEVGTILKGTIVTTDFVMTRVRVWVDENDIVIDVPKAG